MFIHAKVTCPQCGQSSCRPSKWHSRQEKLNYPNSHPYRCPDCSHRYYLRKSANFSLTLALALSAGFVVIVIVILFAIGLPNADQSLAAYTKVEVDDLKAAKKGNAEAQLKVGRNLLQVATHTGKNSAEAVRWLHLAAKNGNTDAMLELGKLYKTGVGALQNFEQSAKWVQLAANRGSAEGMLEVGRLYRDGIGFEKDVVRAYVWFNRAAAAQDMNAVRERENIARTLTFEQLREAQHLSSAVEASTSTDTNNGNADKDLKNKNSKS
jgi:TPR repeat protein